MVLVVLGVFGLLGLLFPPLTVWIWVVSLSPFARLHLGGVSSPLPPSRIWGVSLSPLNRLDLCRAGQDRAADPVGAGLGRTDQLTPWVQGWSGPADPVAAGLVGCSASCWCCCFCCCFLFVPRQCNAEVHLLIQSKVKHALLMGTIPRSPQSHQLTLWVQGWSGQTS